MGRNLYPYSYPYPRVEIHTHTRIHWVLGGYRVPVEFDNYKKMANNLTNMSTKISILTKIISVLSKHTWQVKHNNLDGSQQTCK
jgi:hypothetical protein